MALHAALRKKGNVVGELEKDILEALWAFESGTVRQVLEKIGKKRAVAYTTVMTVMARMVDKGYLVRRVQESGSFLYTPREGREDFYAKTSKALFAQLIRNCGPVAVAQFVDALEEVDHKQLEILKKRLQNLR